MQVSYTNDVKVYNLTSGKSIPEWLSEKKRRELLKKDVQLSRRIELIQDFDMPGVSSYATMSPDCQFVAVSGMYKPTLKCFDVNHMSLKFERCFDNEVIKFSFLSDDYSKILFLQQDRYIEFHNQGGRYFRLRVPKYNRDLVYNDESCDVFIATASSEVYRLNLERGCFLSPLNTSATKINTCNLNSTYRLLLFGTEDGKIEAWDPRVRNEVGVLDCTPALSSMSFPCSSPRVISMDLSGGLQLAAGLDTGHVLLYDIRSDIPLIVKDHQNDLPIKDVKFQNDGDLVYSLDCNALKIWNRNTGKTYTSILSDKRLNSMCVVPRTGLMFLTNDAPKVQVHYIPSIGPAPKWCSFLDSLTEELEETAITTIYDNYKFVTRQELESLGLTHLLGTQLLRAYMHGFFIDYRLYQKARAMIDPFSLEEYRKKKIGEKLDAARGNRVQIPSMVSVNKQLADKLLHSSKAKTPRDKQKRSSSSLLDDSRFNRMFHDPDFEIDQTSNTYKLLHPVLSRTAGSSQTAESRAASSGQSGEFPAVLDLRDDEEDPPTNLLSFSEESDGDAREDDGSSDEEVYHCERRNELRRQRRAELQSKPVLVSNPAGDVVRGSSGVRVREVLDRRAVSTASLHSRLQRMDSSSTTEARSRLGNKHMSFSLEPKKTKKRQGSMQKKHREEALRHHADRRRLRRSAASLHKHSRS